MIVYTVRGGVAAVIWTDVVQMFVYVAGALVVFFALLQQIPGGWAEVVRPAIGGGQVHASSICRSIRRRVYTLWAGLVGGIALTLATHGTDQFLVQRLLSARLARKRRARAGAQRLHRLRAVRAVPDDRRDALHLSTSTCRCRGRSPRNDEILPLFVVTALPHGVAGFIVAAIVAAALSPSINAMAATTVNDFYLKYVRPDADEATLMRVSRQATIVWGIVQIGVALGAQWMQRSVLDAGLAVLSLAAGPVLGAFLVGVLTSRVGSRAMLAGMIAGAVAMVAIWWTGALAWTWYAFVGAAITSAVALALAMLPSFRAEPVERMTATH